MKYFILDQQGHVSAIHDFLNKANPDSVFSRFIRREVNDEVLVSQSDSKPDYLQYANKLGFHWEQKAEIGHVQYDYKANLMRRLVMDYARQLVNEIGLPVYEVSGANMFSLNHPVVEAYASLYGDRLYQFKSGNNDVVMSYDASYPQFNLAGKKSLSYRQLPFAHFSLSDCYRHEQSGELMLLMRQRRFYMPDVHPYFKDMAEAFAWFPRLQAKIVESAKDNNQVYQVMVEIPSQKIWREYQSYIEKIPQWLGADVLVHILDDEKDRYWIVNVDYKIIDKLGQSREIACIQVDVGNASRLDINYIDHNGQSQHPVIIHLAIPGGIERFLYVMFDSFEQGLPFWLWPVHLRLLPVSDEFLGDCESLIHELRDLPLRIELDDRKISVSAKLRSAHEDFVPHKVVIGQREREESFPSLRNLAQELAMSSAGKPFIRREWPAELSRQYKAF